MSHRQRLPPQVEFVRRPNSAGVGKGCAMRGGLSIFRGVFNVCLEKLVAKQDRVASGFLLDHPVEGFGLRSVDVLEGQLAPFEVALFGCWRVNWYCMKS
ncbi:MAG: hypothetical protein ACKVII_10870, partial [Planctomycetales bacterium]